MKVVTVATHSDRYFDTLLDSAKKNNIELIVLGFGEKWQGLIWKFIKMIDYLKKVDPNEIVLFIDAYDVIFIQDSKSIEEKFLEIKKRKEFKILFGVDSIPTNYLYNYVYNKVFNYKKNKNRINSGVYMGYAKDIYDVLNNLHKDNTTNEKNDQILIVNEVIKNPQYFYIDTKHEIILNIFGDPFTSNVNLKNENIEIVYNNNKPYLKHIKFNTTPMILHAPGNGNINDVIIKFNYKLTKNNLISRIKYFKYLFDDYAKYFITEMTIFFILIFIICYNIHKKFKKKDNNIVS